MTGFSCLADQTCEGSGQLPDASSGQDVGTPGGGGNGGDGSSSGCSAQGRSNFSGPASVLFLSLFGALVLGRREESLDLS
jgi:uncharacterized protein (TIGR03382 family)